MLDNKRAIFLKKQFTKDPKKVLDSFVSQPHKFVNKEIETVVEAFLESDQPGAYSWINENWEKFNGRERGILAETSAIEAIKTDNIDIALEWAAHITNIGDRKKLEDLIEAKNFLQIKK